MEALYTLNSPSVASFNMLVLGHGFQVYGGNPGCNKKVQNSEP